MTRAGGFALVSALFLLVVLSAAVAFMLQVTAGQTATTNLAQSSARAYYAARGGIEWGVFHVIDGGATPAPACNGTLTLDGFTVSVACATTPHADPTPRYVTVITAVASRGNPGEAEYVTRELTATVAAPAP